MKPDFIALSLIGSFGLAACTSPQQTRLPVIAANAGSLSQGEACLPFTGQASEIATARTRFNDAIADADLAAITAVLAKDTVLVTGTDSTVLAGRDAQLAIWAEDFAAPDTRLVYARAPACITVSAVAPIAMERGHWRGAATGDTQNAVGGVYSAKWRRVADQWTIEAETYSTTTCTGTLCPASTQGPGQ